MLFSHQKIEIALKFTKEIPLKLFGFKKNCNRLKIYKRNRMVGRYRLKIYKRNPFKNVGWFQKNVGRFQKFGGNTNVNRLLFSD